jgi:NADH-quinone oxidoreductase subunit C
MKVNNLDTVQENLKVHCKNTSIEHSILVLEIEKENLLSVVEKIKKDYQFDLFLDVTAVDWLDQKPRFEVVWHFYSTKHFVRVRIKTWVSEEAPHVATLMPLYGSAYYMERECHDMYGIKFDGNKDLRPILLYGGFVGHPLRKDYPVDKEQPLVPYIK